MPSRICPPLTGSWRPVLGGLGRSDIGPSLGLALAACIALSTYLTLHSAQTQPRRHPLTPPTIAQAYKAHGDTHFPRGKPSKIAFQRVSTRLSNYFRHNPQPYLPYLDTVPGSPPESLPTPDPCPKRPLYPTAPMDASEASKPTPAIKAPADTR